MNREEIVRLTREAGGFDATPSFLERFAELVAKAEREKLKGQIETLGAMYELAAKQRDELMDQQRADIEAMRRKMQ
jgi:hypothetical protein